MRVLGVMFVALLMVAGCSGGTEQPAPAATPAPAAAPPPAAEEAPAEPPADIVSDDPTFPRRGGNPALAAVKNPTPPTEASIKTGQTLYAKNCRQCHGVLGRGDGPLAPSNPRPANLTDGEWDFGGTDGEIHALIMQGAPVVNSEMKPMEGTLAERDVWHIVNYLRSLGPKTGAAAN